MNPKISIICAVFNNAQGLQETLLNIHEQTYENYEIIVIDAASSDNTLEIIKKYPQKIAFWSSEPDKGIYDGMNKGIAHATGEWVVFMNGGDIFYNKDTLKDIAVELTGDYDLVYGANVHAAVGKKQKLRKHKGIEHIWKGMQFSHQSMYARVSLFKEHPYKIQYKLAADYEFVMYCISTKKRIKKIELPLSITEPGGRSDKKRICLYEEHLEIYKSYERNILREGAIQARLFLERVKQLPFLQKFLNK